MIAKDTLAYEIVSTTQLQPGPLLDKDFPVIFWRSVYFILFSGVQNVN